MTRIRPIARRSLGDTIAGELRRLIVHGDLEPGRHLAEDELSSQFGTSRGPVRDALRALAIEGLVRGSGNRAYVHGLTEKDIRDLYQLRGALEALAARSVMEHRDRIDWSELSDRASEMKVAADRADATAFALADHRFHDALYRAADSSRLAQVWSQIHPTFELLVEITTAQDADLHPSSESHGELLDLLQAGDVESTLTHLGIHLQGSQHRMLTAYADRTLSALERS